MRKLPEYDPVCTYRVFLITNNRGYYVRAYRHSAVYNDHPRGVKVFERRTNLKAGARDLAEHVRTILHVPWSVQEKNTQRKKKDTVQ